jgi:RNA polymerase sigma factor (sigma-70 family)
MSVNSPLIDKQDQSSQGSQVARIVARESARLRRFIRSRVGDDSDAEDILQDVFYELVEAAGLAQPIEQVSGWLFRVARNRIVDLFRRKKAASLNAPAADAGDGALEDLLPSPQAGPEAVFARRVLMEQLEAALEELPAEQRAVFLANEMEGRSFKELSAQTGVGVNTLLSRKRYAVLHLRARLRDIFEELMNQENRS